jgi:hypothetical protein
MKPLTEEQIWEVIDGMASPEVLLQHKQLMQTDAAYKIHFEQYTTLQAQLLTLDLDVPSMRFTQNVLDNVLPLTKGAYKKDRAPFFFLIAMVVMAVISSLILGLGNFNLPVNTEGVVTNLSNPIFMNVFILLATVLLFLIVDKKVLKPYFSSKIN